MGGFFSRLCRDGGVREPPTTLKTFFSTLCSTRTKGEGEDEEGVKVKKSSKKQDLKYTRYKRTKTISEQRVIPKKVDLQEVGLDDIDMVLADQENTQAKDVAKYCLPLIVLHFCGMTSQLDDKNSDESTKEQDAQLTLRDYLRMMDRFLRQFDTVGEVTGEEDEFKLLLKLIAVKRHRKNEETVDECYQRLLMDSKRFIEIYHERGVPSEVCEHKPYWASRQQLLAGKVIADYIDPENGELDPIF